MEFMHIVFPLISYRLQLALESSNDLLSQDQNVELGRHVVGFGIYK